jgi:hypothetical protein
MYFGKDFHPRRPVGFIDRQHRHLHSKRAYWLSRRTAVTASFGNRPHSRKPTNQDRRRSEVTSNGAGSGKSLP